MLPGDSDAQTWKLGILKDYNATQVKSSVLLAAHHGSNSFFDLPNDNYWYTSHLQQIMPELTIISVGENPHGHPESKALEFYEKYSTGTQKGRKVYRTDENGNMKLTLLAGGGWRIAFNQ